MNVSYAFESQKIPDYKKIINETPRQEYKDYIHQYILKYFDKLIISEREGRNAMGFITRFYNSLTSIEGDIFSSPEYQEVADFMTDIEVSFMFDRQDIFEIPELGNINTANIKVLFDL